MNFEFYTAAKIVFGNGSFDKLGSLVPQYGRNVLIVSGGGSLERSGVLTRVEEQLRSAGMDFVHYKGVVEEPEPETVEKGLQIALDSSCDSVLAIGGGSVIDTGKAIAGLITNGGPLLDYLEGVGSGRKLTREPVPFIAVPTTSGTGSEVTKNAVITSRSMRFKKSFRSEQLIANVALVDPLLTVTLPPANTAASGMDALTQLIESYTSRKAQPIPEALALYGIELAGRSLRRACLNGSDIGAREAMAMASLLSGICLANSGLGAAHGIAAALGSYYGIPHGLACAILLPYVMEYNAEAKLEKFARIGRILSGSFTSEDRSAAASGIEWVKKLNSDIGIPQNFKSYGISEQMLPELAEASKGNSMSGNPIEMTKEDTMAFIRKLI